MGAPTYFRYDDTSAPTLDGIAGSLIALLRAVLVDGYGSQSGLGWTLEFINTAQTIAVFRNDAVNGFGKYFRIDDTYGMYAKISAFESMSDIDTGSGRIPGGDGSTTQYYLVKSAAASTVTRPWLIIGDSRGVWYLSYAGNTTLATDSYYCAPSYFGDCIGRDTTDSYFSGIFCCYGTAYSNNYFPQVSSSITSMVTGCALFRDYLGTTMAPAVGLHASPYFPTSPGAGGLTVQVNGQYQFFSPEVVTSASSYRMLGTIPGLFVSSHHYSLITSFTEIVEGSHTLLPLNYFINGRCQLFIDLSENFRP